MVKQVQEQVKFNRLNMKQVMDTVKKEMVGLTSLPFHTITGVSQDEETNAPIITMELVERKAIPDSMDLLGLYEIMTDDAGSVKTFKRVSMRKRGDAVSNTEY